MWQEYECIGAACHPYMDDRHACSCLCLSLSGPTSHPDRTSWGAACSAVLCTPTAGKPPRRNGWQALADVSTLKQICWRCSSYQASVQDLSAVALRAASCMSSATTTANGSVCAMAAPANTSSAPKSEAAAPARPRDTSLPWSTKRGLFYTLPVVGVLTSLSLALASGGCAQGGVSQCNVNSVLPKLDVLIVKVSNIFTRTSSCQRADQTYRARLTTTGQSASAGAPSARRFSAATLNAVMPRRSMRARSAACSSAASAGHASERPCRTTSASLAGASAAKAHALAGKTLTLVGSFQIITTYALLTLPSAGPVFGRQSMH